MSFYMVKSVCVEGSQACYSEIRWLLKLFPVERIYTQAPWFLLQVHLQSEIMATWHFCLYHRILTCLSYSYH